MDETKFQSTCAICGTHLDFEDHEYEQLCEHCEDSWKRDVESPW